MEQKSLHADSKELEKEHVHDVYKHIAVHFSETRYKPWPRVAQFLQQQPNGSLIADVGCGNGKYLGVCPHAFILGSDMCPPLVSIAGGRGHEVLVCDCLNLPYRSNAFDAVLCIAVIHHLSTRERRVDALRELVRVTQPGGKVLVYVWAMEQERKKFTQQDVMVPWHLQTINFQKKADSQKPRKKKKNPHPMPMEERPLEKTSSDLQGEHTDTGEPDRNEDSRNFDPKDSMKGHVGGEDDPIISGSFVDPTPPLKEAAATSQQTVKSDPGLQEIKGSQTFQRYYHVFCKGELKLLFSEGVPAAKVKEEYYDHENWCVVAEKLTSS